MDLSMILYRLFYKPLIWVCSKIIIICCNLRCYGHHKFEYMQNRVIYSVKELLPKEEEYYKELKLEEEIRRKANQVLASLK